MLAERFRPTLLRITLFRVLLSAAVCGLAVVSFAQLNDELLDLEHPAISYSTRATTDRVATLNTRLQSGQVKLAFDPVSGYLKAVLDALQVPVDSQVALFSKTSLQSPHIRPDNPRTIFFNDAVVVAWVRGGFIEIASQDAQQGAIFYRMLQAPSGPPLLLRENRCLQCHYSFATSGVPGHMARSVPSATDGSPLPWLGNANTDHRSPLTERWGGWFVTGTTGSIGHLGNAPVRDKRIDEVQIEDSNLNLPNLLRRFDTTGYLSPHSDVVALLVFDHQIRMMNLLTRIGWEARTLAHEGRTESAMATGLRPTAIELVDYLLFVDEAPLAGVRGTSGFAASFEARGPYDSKGRTLRDLDLTRRLFTYPCSYMIYSEAFDALPGPAKNAVYSRMWDVLSGAERGTKYARLTQDDRQNVIEILRETKKDLPAAFSPRPSRP